MTNYLVILTIVLVFIGLVLGVVTYMYFRFRKELSFCEQHMSPWCPLYTCANSGIGATRHCIEGESPFCTGGIMRSSDASKS